MAPPQPSEKRQGNSSSSPDPGLLHCRVELEIHVQDPSQEASPESKWAWGLDDYHRTQIPRIIIPPGAVIIPVISGQWKFVERMHLPLLLCSCLDHATHICHTYSEIHKASSFTWPAASDSFLGQLAAGTRPSVCSWCKWNTEPRKNQDKRRREPKIQIFEALFFTKPTLISFGA